MSRKGAKTQRHKVAGAKVKKCFRRGWPLGQAIDANFDRIYLGALKVMKHHFSLQN